MNTDHHPLRRVDAAEHQAVATTSSTATRTSRSNWSTPDEGRLSNARELDLKQSSSPAETLRIARWIVTLLRGATRLALGLVTAGIVTYATLRLAELAMRWGGVLSYENVVGSFWFVLAIALGLGAATAAGTDRLWRSVRARGPRLARTP